MIKAIKIMPDFISTGLWDYSDGIMLEYDDICLPQDLIEALESWVDYYDTCFKRPEYSPIPGMFRDLNIKGIEISKKIKSILFNVPIIYVGEDESGLLEGKEITT